MALIDERQLEAMLALLDDQDEEVYHHISEQLVHLGPDIMPSLMKAWEGTVNTELQDRIEQVMHQIQIGYVLEEFRDWTQSPEQDPLTGALLIARHRYPDFNENRVWNLVDQMKRTLSSEMRGSLSPVEQVNIFNHVFYRHFEFNARQSEQGETDENDLYLNLVIESKRGNAISLGILYLSLARQMGMPVYGIHLPNQFCMSYLKHEVDEQYLGDDAPAGPTVLFYINPANNGLIFTRHEIKEYLDKLGEPHDPAWFKPISTFATLRQLVQVMQERYRENRKYREADELEKFQELMED